MPYDARQRHIGGGYRVHCADNVVQLIPYRKEPAMTRQRALILEILQHSPKHLTADEIFAIAREKMPGIARGTVYRNLKLMEQAREIARPCCYKSNTLCPR